MQCQRLLTDESPRLRNALRYTIYGKSGVFDAERFIDVMQAFENFITAAKSGGGEDLNGNMAELGILQSQSGFVYPGFPFSSTQTEQPVQTRAALAFLLSDKGNFFREFLLDEVFESKFIYSSNLQHLPDFLDVSHYYFTNLRITTRIVLLSLSLLFSVAIWQDIMICKLHYCKSTSKENEGKKM